MSAMVQIALAEDSRSLKVFVAEAAVEAAQDVIEPPTDLDEPIAEL